MSDRRRIARDPGARDLYTRAMQPYERLREQAEQERRLRAAAPCRSRRANRLLIALGRMLIAAGQRVQAAGGTRPDRPSLPHRANERC